jgi:hypothetical protein
MSTFISGGFVESLLHRYPRRDDTGDDYAPIPASKWGDVPVMAPWRPPAPPAMNSDDFAPVPAEPDWQRLRSTAPTAKPRAASVDDGADYAPCPKSPWD